MSLRSTTARGDKTSCNTDTICFLRWSIPRADVCNTTTSSYRSAITPDNWSPSEFTTRYEVAPGMYRRRNATASRTRPRKNPRSISTRSADNTRTRMRDAPLNKPTPRNRCR